MPVDASLYKLDQPDVFGAIKQGIEANRQNQLQRSLSDLYKSGEAIDYDKIARAHAELGYGTEAATYGLQAEKQKREAAQEVLKLAAEEKKLAQQSKQSLFEKEMAVFNSIYKENPAAAVQYANAKLKHDPEMKTQWAALTGLPIDKLPNLDITTEELEDGLYSVAIDKNTGKEFRRTYLGKAKKAEKGELSAYSSIALDMRNQDRITRQWNTIRESSAAKDYEGTIRDADTALTLLENPNSLKDKATIFKIARAFQGGGVLTQQDVESVSGGRSAYQRLSQGVEEFATGKLTPQNRAMMQDALITLKKAADKKRQAYYDREATSFAKRIGMDAKEIKEQWGIDSGSTPRQQGEIKGNTYISGKGKRVTIK